MLEHFAHRHTTDIGRRTLDRAEGVLMGILGCTAEAAFAELLDTARASDIALSALTDAVLDVACARGAGSPAHDVVRGRWGTLMGPPAVAG